MSVNLKIHHGDIALLEVDAIVNAANPSLLGGGGVDGAIHKAAGPNLLKATRKLGGAATGEVKMTEGFDLPSKFVLHAVGPIYGEDSENESQLLAACYKKALKIADKNGLHSIAFSAISTGVYGYPIQEATQIAVSTVLKTIPQLKHLKEIIFVVFDSTLENLYEEEFKKIK